MLAGVVGAAGPLIASGVTGGFNLKGEEPLQYLQSYVTAHPLLLAYLFCLLLLVSLAGLAFHSWIEAGSFGIYLEGESRARSFPPASPGRFSAFTVEKWLSFARRFWWQFFILYNLIWTLYLLLLLIPLAAVAAMVYFSDGSQSGMFLGCAGMGLWFVAAFVGSLIVASWNQLAMALMVMKSLTPRAAMRQGWTLLWRRLGPVIASAGAIIAIAIIAAIVLAAYYSSGTLVENLPAGKLIMFPFQILFSISQMFFSVFISAWLTAAFAALASDHGSIMALERDRGER